MSQADAHGGEAELGIFTLHLINQRGANTRPGTTQRMTERDRPAVEVDLLIDLLHQAQIFNARQDLRGKGLIHFKDVDIAGG